MGRKEEKETVKDRYSKAFGRMEKGEEPTPEDWWLFRCMHRSWFVFSKKKRELYNHLYKHLSEHTEPFNKDELFTFRLLF